MTVFLYKIRIFLTVVLLVKVFKISASTPLDPPCDVPCTPPWFRDNSSCYGRFPVNSSDELNFNDSRKFCKSEGGDLVIIKERQLLDLLKPSVSSNERYWIGLRRNEKAYGDIRSRRKHWFWVDNTPLTDSLQKWELSEPSQGDECGSLGLQYGWFARNCLHTTKFICEKGCMTTTTTTTASTTTITATTATTTTATTTTTTTTKTTTTTTRSPATKQRSSGTSSASSATVPSASANDNDDNSSTSGLVAGSVVGGLILIVILVVVVILYLRKLRARHNTSDSKSQIDSHTYENGQIARHQMAAVASGQTTESISSITVQAAENPTQASHDYENVGPLAEGEESYERIQPHVTPERHVYEALGTAGNRD